MGIGLRISQIVQGNDFQVARMAFQHCFERLATDTSETVNAYARSHRNILLHACCRSLAAFTTTSPGFRESVPLSTSRMYGVPLGMSSTASAALERKWIWRTSIVIIISKVFMRKGPCYGKVTRSS